MRLILRPKEKKDPLDDDSPVQGRPLKPLNPHFTPPLKNPHPLFFWDIQ